MGKKNLAIFLSSMILIMALLLVGVFLIGDVGNGEPIQEVMKDTVLHNNDKVDLFGLKVNPGLIAAFVVTGILFVFALIVRIFVIPRFKLIPNKFQIFLEDIVSMFDRLAKSNSPERNSFLGAYVFVAGVYIFSSTIFELFGLQVVTVNGHSVSMPAPLSDINGAIAMGVLSYLIIMSGGVIANGFRGLGNTLKDFSLPISMSFRLFGALLSGALVTELVYYSLSLSFVIPVAVAVLFTLIHALIQAYVLVMLVSLFYGEVSEKPVKIKKTHKKIKLQRKENI